MPVPARKLDLHQLLWVSGISFVGFVLSLIWYVRAELQANRVGEQHVMSVQAAVREARERLDAVARIEHDTMRLAESAEGAPDENRQRAMAMLHDENYHTVRAGAIKPMASVLDQIEARTLQSVRDAEDRAALLRWVFLALGVLAVGTPLYVFWYLRSTLGGSVAQLQQHIARIGQGDLSATIVVPEGQKDSVFGRLADMQTRLREVDSQRRLAEEELRIAAVTFDSQEVTMVTDAHGVILRVNRAFTEVTGYTAEEVIGQTPRILQSGLHDKDFYRTMWEAIVQTGLWKGEVWGKTKSGKIYPKWLTIAAVRDDTGKATHYVGSHYDITERKKAEEKINALAFYDQLTGLPNRTLLADRLKQTLARCERNRQHGALLFMDLDHFKVLNDTQGHDMGDMLLKQVAERVQHSIRDDDTAARVGGDEFVVVLSGLSKHAVGAARTAESIAGKILAALNQGYQLGDTLYHCGASIGVTLFFGGNTLIEELMKQADMAMYRSKLEGRNLVRFFDPAMEVDVKARAALESDVREALEQEQFVLHYQPQIVADGRVTGAEALIRWSHPVRGMVTPADFIPAAESTHLIQPLGRWVLNSACQTLARWAHHEKLAPLTVAVNISAHQLREADFVEQVIAAIKLAGINPQRLKLELTESVLVEDVEVAIQKMYALKAIGVGFSMDDFGTGYSSLTYLKRLPLDQLKIDQSFVRDLLSDANDAVIAKTIVALGQSLGLNVIAEGVETSAQREFLAATGCLAYQGYLFSRPLPVAAFEDYVEKLAAV